MTYTAEFNLWLRATNSIRRASGVRPYSFAKGFARWQEIQAAGK